MKKPPKTLHLDFEKDPVKIDVITHANGLDFIEITQTTPDATGKNKKARLSKAQFDMLVNGLLQFQSNFQEELNQEFQALTDAEKQLLWDGNKYFQGLTAFFEFYHHFHNFLLIYKIMIIFSS